MARRRAALCLILLSLELAAAPCTRAQRVPEPHTASGQQRKRAANHFLTDRGVTGTQTRSPARMLLDAREQRSRMPVADTSGPTPSWLPAGPATVSTSAYGAVTGRITSIAADPADTSGNTVYFGSTGGGVWKSTNAASTNSGSPPVFQPLTDTLPVFAAGGQGYLASLSIGALTVQPGATGVVLAGTGDINDALDSYYGVGILRSADGGNSWDLVQGSSDGYNGGTNYEWQGEGFAGFAWSTTNPQLVVAATATAVEGIEVNAESAQFTIAGLYYSPDAGQTWYLATIKDQSGQVIQSANRVVTPPGASVTSVVWNNVRKRFYAAVRFHGYYESLDGITWTRLVNQPGANLSTTACPTNPGSQGSQACPIFRGVLAVQPVTGDMFALTTDVNTGDQGLFQDKCSINGLAVSSCASSTVLFGTQLNSTPFEVGGGNTQIAQADYNLALAAVPQLQDTILLVGTEDIFRCSLANSCAWRNTTNVNTCDSALVAPAEHAIESTLASSGLLYFGNDGGLWRTTDTVGQTGAVCAATDASHYQNLNTGLGSLAEVSHFAVDPSNSSLLLASIGGFGTVAAESPASETQGSTAPWQQVLTGEGGFVAIDPNTPQNWYADAGAGVTIHRCTSGSSCTAAGFGASPAVGRTQVNADGNYDLTAAPWILDPSNTANLLVGTCRVWRGPATGSGWSSSNLLSPMLDGNQQSMCTSNATLRSLAASGTIAGTSGSERVYAGMNGYATGGSTVPGHMYAATVTQSSGVFSWTDLWTSPVINNTSSGGQFNPGRFTIPTIAVDPHDSTGQTVYAGIQGFPGNGINSQLVYRSTDGGAHWLDISGGLPIAPVNSIVVDPNQASTVYLATDAGVYVTQAISSCGVQNCWAVYGTGLPNTPVTELKLFNNGSGSVLLASTYGRGIWKISLATAQPTATATLNPNSLNFGAQTVNTSSGTRAVTLSNTGSVALTIAGITVSGDYSENNNCPSSMAAGASCTVNVAFSPTATGDRAGLLTVSANVSGGQVTATLDGTGQAAGAVTLTPGSLTFSSTVVGQTSAAQTITATNSGGSSITVGTPSLSAEYAFASNTCSNVQLAAGTSCTMQIAFSPLATGSRAGQLTLPSSAPSSPATATLNGTGIAQAALTLSPSSLTFASTAVGSTSAAQAITVTSSGGVTVQLGAPSTSANYNISSSSCGATLAPGASCSLNLTFTPSATGSRAGLLTVPASNISGGQVTASLYGSGVTPASLTLSPSPLNFSGIVVGGTSAASSVTVTAGGGVASQLGTPSTSSSYAVASNSCGSSLSPGSSCTIGVIFQPVSTGDQPGTLTLPAPNVAGGSVTDSLDGAGLSPAALTLTPSSLTFPATGQGSTSAAQTVTVNNTGGVAAQLGTSSVTGDYALSQSTCGTQLAAGASCILQITFTPMALGSRSGVLTVPASNISGGSVTASLTGTGASPGSLALSPTSSSFSTVAVGATSAPTTFTATNSGGVSVTLQPPATTGDYVVASTTCGASLSAGSSCTVQVTFTPTATGARSGVLSVSGSFAGSPATAALSGTGVAPAALGFSPSPVSFPGTAVGSTSATQAIIVTNTGGVPAQLGSTSVTSNYTLAGNSCGSSLAAGASCTIQVVFQPGTTGVLNGTLAVQASNISGGQASDSLSGTGLAPAALTLSPGSENYGSVAQGSASSSQPFTVTSTGGVPAQLAAPSVTGDYSLDSTTCGASLAPGANCTVQVSFRPNALGDRPGLLTVPASNVANGKVTATLDGNGLAPGMLSASPTGLSFPATAQGASSAAQTVTLTSSGGVAVQLGTASISTSDYQITGNTCGTALAPAATCTVQIIFHPAAIGSRPASLSLPNNTAQSPLAVALSGTALAPGALSLSPTALSFSPAAVGVASVQKSVTVTNSGGVAVQVGTVIASPADYQVASNSCGSSLGAGASCVVQVVFTPAQSGSRPGLLTIPGDNGQDTVTATLDGAGLTPGTLTLSPAAYSFGASVIGTTSSPVTLTATNSGQVAVSTQIPTITGDFAVASTNCGTSLSPGYSCTVQVTFTPTVSGARTGVLAIAGAFAGSPATASLSGTGLQPGNITLSPTAYNFSPVAVGTSSAPVAFTATNSGGVAVSIQNVSAGGDFAIASTTCGSSIAAGANCVLQVTFTPTAPGSRAGVLSVAGNFAASPATASLGGSGLAPGNLVLSPTGYNFGAVGIGSTSSATFFTATNTGGVAVTLQAPSASGDFALVSNNCGATVPAGANCSLGVTFSPTVLGARSGTLAVGGNFGGSPATASLLGTGLTPGNVALSPTSLSFGSAAVGSSSAPVTVVATNNGGAAVTLSAPTVSGDFAILTTTCGATLAANGSCTLQITFAPTTAGSRAGTLSLAGTFPGSPGTVALAGTGLAPGMIVLSPAALGFGSVVLGSSAQLGISATNSGGVAVPLTGASISGPDYQIVSNSCPATLAAGASCTLVISFTPAAPGSRAGTLSMAGTFSGSPAAAALSGTGTAPGNLLFTPASLSFGAVTENTISPSATITATNSGGTPVSLQPPAVTINYRITATSCGSTLSPGGSCTLSVAFAPTGTGDAPGLLTVAGSMPGGQATAGLDGTGVAPAALGFTPASLVFGSAIVGTAPASMSASLVNTGGTAATISPGTVTGDFAVSQKTCGTSLGAGSSCTFTLSFSPTATGNRSGSLTISGSFPQSPIALSLVGNGAAAGSLTLAPTSLTFGTVLEGTTASAQSVRLTNSGGRSLAIPSPTVTGDYTLVADSCASILAAGTSCTLGVAFSPTAAGDRSGLLTVAGAAQSVSLDGTGQAPASVSFSPASLSFAALAAGSVSPPQTITATNNGGALALLQSPTVTGDFSLGASSCSSTLAVGASCALQVVFAPLAAGDRPGRLTLLVPAPGTGAAATLDGTGLPRSNLVLTPAMLTFAAVNVGAVSPAGNITVANTSAATMPLGSPAISGDFLISANSCGAILPAQTSCTVSVLFSPTAGGTRTGTFTIASGTLTSSASLSGTGIAPATDTLAPSSLSFPSQTVGTVSSAQTVTMTNRGDATLAAISVVASGPFTVSNNCGGTLAGHASCGLVVVYAPTLVGAAAGTLTVTDTIRSQTVLLSGTGAAPPTAFVSPASLSFGGYVVAGTSPPQTILVSNNGATPLTGMQIGVTGSGFAQSSSTCGLTLAPGTACAVNVTFTPPAIGGQTGQVTVTSPSLNQPLVTNLSGSGEDFEVAIMGAAQAVLTSGQSTSFEVQVTPVGASAATLVVACSGAPANSTCTPNPLSLQLTGSATGTAIVTIATGVQTAALDRPWARLVSLLALLVPALWLPRRARRLCAVLLLSLALAVLPTACGVHASSGSSSKSSASGGTGAGTATPPGTYTVTVSASFPGAQRTATFTLVVQ